MEVKYISIPSFIKYYERSIIMNKSRFIQADCMRIVILGIHCGLILCSQPLINSPESNLTPVWTLKRQLQETQLTAKKKSYGSFWEHRKKNPAIKPSTQCLRLLVWRQVIVVGDANCINENQKWADRPPQVGPMQDGLQWILWNWKFCNSKKIHWTKNPL